jgi:dTDP-4-dehydrorhamnose 3,5-epimerase
VRFHELGIAGAYSIDIEPVVDERGWFGRVFSYEAFTEFGLDARVAQCSVSFNRRASTLRGMHFQRHPDEESKLVLCVAGAVYDVLVDVRPTSATHKTWTAVHLSASGQTALFVPPGVAHGFLTLQDDTTVYYQISAPYSPQAASGVRWNDPAFGIEWPLMPSVISARDAAFEDYTG